MDWRGGLLPDYKPRKLEDGAVVESSWRGVTRGGRYDRNPNAIVEQEYRLDIPLAPRRLDAPIEATPMGPIGIAVNGVPLYRPRPRLFRSMLFFRSSPR